MAGIPFLPHHRQEAIIIAQGKFSKPRSSSTPDELLDRTFREVVEQPVIRKPVVPTPAEPASEPDAFLPEDFLETVPEEDILPDLYDTEPEDQAYLPQEDREEAEPAYEEESPFFAFFTRHRKVLLICICSLILVALLGTIAGICIVNMSDPYDNRILNNVSVAGLNLGGMTKEEARTAISREYGNVYSNTDMVVTLSDTVLTFSPAATGAELDVDALVSDAYSYGRSGTKAEKEAAYQSSLVSVHTIGLLPYLNLNEEYIQKVLQEYASGFESIFTEASYRLEGEMPALETEKFDADAHCQLLLITMGTPGMGADIDALYDEIMDAYSMRVFSIEKEEASPDTVPALPDLQAIYDELYIAPVDSSIDMKTFETIPGSYGYDFDLEEAQRIVEQAEFGETVQISMRYVEPEILDDEVLFRDVLGSCQTKHTDNENRNINLKIACETINDTILMPGETFSFNDCLGERTEEKGYKPAGTYVGNKLVDSIGGGICQCSTTLYYCTLLADMEIVDRINHGLPVTYIDYGMDATVSWGGPDFKFRNNSNFPIKLKAEVSDGYVKMQILGTDEKDYYIKMEYEFTGWEFHETVYEEHEPDSGYKDGEVLQNGSDGIYVRSYKCKYNKETDELMSRDFEARSSYKRVDKVVVKIVEPGQETQPSETTPGTTPPEETKPADIPTTEATTPPETTEAPPETTTAPPEPTTVPPETTSPAPSPSENAAAEDSAES